LVLRGGEIVLPGMAPYRADITINGASVGSSSGTQIVEIGDLTGAVAKDTIDASGLFVHPVMSDSAQSLQPGMRPAFHIRRTADPASELVWEVLGLRARRMMAR